MSTATPGYMSAKVYIFFREAGWYPLELKDDLDAQQNAETNPGTLKVEDINGRIVWPIEQQP